MSSEQKKQLKPKRYSNLPSTLLNKYTCVAFFVCIIIFIEVFMYKYKFYDTFKKQKEYILLGRLNIQMHVLQI